MSRKCAMAVLQSHSFLIAVVALLAATPPAAAADYVVRLTAVAMADDAASVGRDLAGTYGGRIGSPPGDGAIALEIAPAKAALLAADPRVAAVRLRNGDAPATAPVVASSSRRF